MKKLFFPTVLVLGLLSCENHDIEPSADILQLLSGELSNGKDWKMTNFKTTSNYFTFNTNKFQTKDSWNDYPESIKDNTTIIFPDGAIQIDEEKIKYNKDSPQIYIDQQFWTFDNKQDSVDIVDYVGLPSLHGKWGITVSAYKITLTREERDVGFKGSLLTQTVTFLSMD